MCDHNALLENALKEFQFTTSNFVGGDSSDML